MLEPRIKREKSFEKKNLKKKDILFPFSCHLQAVNLFDYDNFCILCLEYSQSNKTVFEINYFDICEFCTHFGIILSFFVTLDILKSLS